MLISTFSQFPAHCRFRCNIVRSGPSVRERGGNVRVRRSLGQVDEQLDEAALGRGVVTQHVGEGCVAERLGETLAQGLASAGVVAQAARN
jgi:hypothetical protein